MAHPQTAGPMLVVRHTGQVFPLTRATITIGRQGDNAVVVSDPQASRRHAAVFWDAGEYQVQDLGSANGTYLNERQIVGPQPLQHGYVLRVGNTVFDVQLMPGTAQVTSGSALAEAGLPAGVAPAVAQAGRLSTQPSLSAPYSPRRRRTTSPFWAILFGLLVVGLVLGCSVIAVAGFLPFLRGVVSTVAIQAPAQDARIAAGNEIVLRATASGAGDITRLDLSLDGLLVATATSVDSEGDAALTVTQPWIFDRLGPHLISAVAYTAKGQVSTPVFRSFTVVDASQPAATSPATASPTNTREPATSTPTATQIPTETANPTSTPSGPPPPGIEFFRASPQSIARGECATLQWGAVTQAASAIIDQGIGGVGTPDTRRVCPTETTTYTLIASGPGGTVTASVTVMVSP